MHSTLARQPWRPVSSVSVLLAALVLSACGGGTDSPAVNADARSGLIGASDELHTASPQPDDTSTPVIAADGAVPASAPAASATPSFTRISRQAQPPGLSFISMMPKLPKPGNAVIINGSGFSTGIKLFWGETELPVTYVSGNRITSKIPANTPGGTFALRLQREDGATVNGPYVGPPVAPKVSAMSHAKAQVGQAVRITGERMYLVERISMGEQTATIQKRSNTEVEFLVPTGAASGSVVLHHRRDDGMGSATDSFSAGILTVENLAASLQLGDIDLAQSYMHSVNQPQLSPYLRIVPGRAMMIRVRFKEGSVNSETKPDVRLTVKKGDASKGTQQQMTVRMNGPATGSPEIPAHGASLESSHSYVIAAEWVQQGFEFSIEAKDLRTPDKIERFAYVPAPGVLGLATYKKVHFIPLKSNGNPTMTAATMENLKKEIRQAFPLSEIDFVTEKSDPLASLYAAQHDDVKAVYRINQIREASNPKSYDLYYGIKTNYNISSGRAFFGGNAAVGGHGRGVTLHELGHTMGLHDLYNQEYWYPYTNASASSPADMSQITAATPLYPIWLGPDAFISAATGKNNYPLGPTGTGWIMRSLDNWQFQRSDGGGRDLMDSGSNLDSFSDYSFAAMYAHLERTSPLSAKPVGHSQEVVSPVIHVTGTIDSTQSRSRLSPLMRKLGTPDTYAVSPVVAAKKNDVMLEVQTNQGVYLYPLTIQKPTHSKATDDAYFSATITAIDQIKSIQLVRGNNKLATVGAQAAPLARNALPVPVLAGAKTSSWGSYHIDGKQMTLNWDAKRWPWMSLTKITDQGIQAVAVMETGGVFQTEWSADARSMTIGLSDGINTKIEEVQF
ncbi:MULTISPECIES: IPT/TIG domain-containing protein [unclassified Undibacterium]|nr:MULTISPECIES: IPT/TIG domain-containing protein [unclassified Undibacterium]MEB0216111.1 IPT/TIG domain-containing protein [Undibacterium sp. 5I2]WPX42006.1 IPT/TIG domain-containing protein [Undibacterium sp. CCC3.4]